MTQWLLVFSRRMRRARKLYSRAAVHYTKEIKEVSRGHVSVADFFVLGCAHYFVTVDTIAETAANTVADTLLSG